LLQSFFKCGSGVVHNFFNQTMVILSGIVEDPIKKDKKIRINWRFL